MPTTTEQPTISSLEQLIEASPELQKLSTDMAQRETRRDEVADHVAELVGRQHELRRDLAATDTEAQRSKARTALATTAAEVTVLPDEVTMAAEAFALALHHWAAAAIAEVEKLSGKARHARNNAVAEARAAYEEAVAKDRNDTDLRALSLRDMPHERRLQLREHELEKIRRQITGSCLPVFPHGEIGTLTTDGELRGHERWRDHQRAEIEERLRA